MATIIDGSLAPRGEKKSFPNGMSWEQSNVTSGHFGKPYFSNNLWLVPCIDSGSQALLYSLNGKLWADTGLPRTNIQHIAYANGLWIAACNAGLYYSYSGKAAWAKISSISGVCHTIYNYNGIWVTSNDSKTYYSTDGLNWTASASNVYGLQIISAANGLWLASDIEGMQYYSSDGKSWTQGSLGAFDAICNAGGLWVASSGSYMYYSSDGKSWAQGTKIGNSAYCIVNAQGVWVASSNAGIFYSADGKTWSNVLSKEVNSVYYANGIWIAGEYNGIYYSIDGKKWEKVENATPYIRVLAANGMWVAATGNGLYYSPTWEAPPPVIAEEWVLKSSPTISPLTVGDYENVQFKTPFLVNNMDEHDTITFSASGSMDMNISIGDTF